MGVVCIIAEKPSVARDIARIVGATTKQEGYVEGNGYIVTWAIGHLITLAMPEQYGYGEYKKEDLPICPQSFQLVVRQVRNGKEYKDDTIALKQLKIIRTCFEKADRIIAATDAGREGELIFRYIYQYLNCHKPFVRLWISSLTDKAIREGLSNLKEGRAYDNLYYSAKSRSEADWLVGINASRALSIARKGGYSLGRVQTPTLAMVCKRYIEHRDFKKMPYWKLSVLTSKEDIEIKAVSQNSFEQKEGAACAVLEIAKSQALSVEKVTRKTSETAPPLLYDLTTLQKDANKRYSFSADKTLSIAQSLYEKKITTYPRTGSRYISEDVFEEVPNLLKALQIDVATPLNPHSVDDTKVTDHHAIIPTGEVATALSKEEELIYEMVKTRFIESFSPNSMEERMQVELTDGTTTYQWKACQVISLGWKAVKKVSAEENKYDENSEEVIQSLPNLTEGETLPLLFSELTEHQTKPKPLFTDASLLSAMEHAGKEIEDAESKRAIADCGIGTPATRANIIETLILRGYIKREKKTLLPTEKGLAVYEIVQHKRIANVEMTGNWELALEGISEGRVSPLSFMGSIQKYSAEICKELLSMELPTNDKTYPTYTCPKCEENSVGIYAKVVRCKNEGCDFHIFREVCGSFLSEDNIKDLLTNN